MKSTTPLLAACALLLATLPATAQVFVGSDNFDGGFDTAKWDAGYRINAATQGNLSFNSNRMDFSIPPGAGGNYHRLWNSDGTVNPYVTASSFTTGWVMTVKATNTLTGITGGNFSAIGFQVFNDDNSYSALMLNVNNAGLSVRAEGVGFATVETAPGDGTDVSLRLTWDATAQTLGAAYSLDGVAFTSVATFLPVSQWANPNGTTDNGFNFGIFGSTNLTTGIGVSSMFVDDFSLAASAIPEPSTYAALAGLGALALAFWQRRRQTA